MTGLKSTLARFSRRVKGFVIRFYYLLTSICSLGQAYVALSRATSLDGLQVLNFNPSKVCLPVVICRRRTNSNFQVQAHPKVVQWSDTLETIPSEPLDAYEEEASWTL